MGFWNRVYTRQGLMKDSMWFLLLISAGQFLIGVIRLRRGEDESIIYAGILYLIAALIPAFWVRFIVLAIWVTDLMYSNFVLRFVPTSIFYMVIGTSFLYKMWKYRNNRAER